MKMIVTFESGKQYTYEKGLIDLMLIKARILENADRHNRLGMETDKAINFEIIK